MTCFRYNESWSYRRAEELLGIVEQSRCISVGKRRMGMETRGDDCVKKKGFVGTCIVLLETNFINSCLPYRCFRTDRYKPIKWMTETFYC